MKNLARVSLLIALYYLVYHVYIGFIRPVPALGDSWDYHIPIAKSILDLSFLQPDSSWIHQRYYPGSSEAINSIFMLLHVPLTLTNVLATVILCISLYQLARVFKLDKYLSLIFALGFVSINVVVRWLNAVSVDVWMAVYFVQAVIFLENPSPKAIYFIKLGLFFGLLIGTKYTGIPLSLILLAFYGSKVLPSLNLPRLTSFFIPFSLFGLFWYIRNFISTGNPFYPTPIFGLPGIDIFGGLNVAKIFVQHPLTMLNSAFGEYTIWLAAVFLVTRHRSYILGLACLALFLALPTSAQPWIMVSSFRYSYPAFILLILNAFLVLQKRNFLPYVAIAASLVVTSLTFHPKLILISLPLAIWLGRFLL